MEEADKEQGLISVLSIPSPITNADSESHVLREQNAANYLLQDLDNAMFDNTHVVYVKKPLSTVAKRTLKCLGIFLFVFLVLCFLVAFVALPLVFMNSLSLQRLVMFTNLGLQNEGKYFRNYEILAGYRNLYVSVNDLKSTGILSLGVWHILPYILQNNVITNISQPRISPVVITNNEFDFDNALKYSNRSVLMYFHGTGEDRSTSFVKYRVFRTFFHVITFDYRSYGDSSKGELSEEAVVNDCVQLYEWLTTKTSAPIFIWGHSLGTALAARTLSIVRSKNISQPVGLVLEAPFTRMSEELYVHPYGKIFAWLPWFEATIIKPLEKNGFVFNTGEHLLNIECPVMILSSEDDSIVPYRFGEKLYAVAKNRTSVNTTLYYEFDNNLGYDHYFLYEDPFLPFFINYFLHICCAEQSNKTVQSL